MTTISSHLVRAVLDELYADKEVKDVRALETFTENNRPIDDYTHEQLNAMFADAYISIPREAGDFLYLLARNRRVVSIVEFGTSFGISTIFLAAAARDNGGRVITTEWLSAKADVAMRNLAKAGLADLVEMRVGDALESLAELSETVNLVFLDGWKDFYLPVLRLLEPSLAPDALVVADNITGKPADKPFLNHLGEGYHSVRVVVGHGMVIAIRLPI